MIDRGGGASLTRDSLQFNRASLAGQSVISRKLVILINGGEDDFTSSYLEPDGKTIQRILAANYLDGASASDNYTRNISAIVPDLHRDEQVTYGRAVD